MTDITPDADPPADPDETALLQELESVFEAQQPTGQEEPEETPEEETAEPDVEEAPEEEPEPEEAGLSREEIAQLQGIRDALAQDAALRSKIVEHYQQAQAGSPAAPTLPATEPPAPLPELDLDDPAIAALAARIEAQNEQLARITQAQQMQQQTWEQQRIADAEAHYRTASESFRREHGLEPSDIEHLSAVAARLGVLPQLLQSGVDPITGIPVRPDPIYAVERSLEIAYFNDPKYREHEQRRLATERHQANQRKQRLAAVDGKSGSAPRKPAEAPQGTDAKRDAMIREVAEAMFQGNGN